MQVYKSQSDSYKNVLYLELKELLILSSLTYSCIHPSFYLPPQIRQFLLHATNWRHQRAQVVFLAFNSTSGHWTGCVPCPCSGPSPASIVPLLIMWICIYSEKFDIRTNYQIPASSLLWITLLMFYTESWGLSQSTIDILQIWAGVSASISILFTKPQIKPKHLGCALALRSPTEEITKPLLLLWVVQIA